MQTGSLGRAQRTGRVRQPRRRASISAPGDSPLVPDGLPGDANRPRREQNGCCFIGWFHPATAPRLSAAGGRFSGKRPQAIGLRGLDHAARPGPPEQTPNQTVSAEPMARPGGYLRAVNRAESQITAGVREDGNITGRTGGERREADNPGVAPLSQPSANILRP